MSVSAPSSFKIEHISMAPPDAVYLRRLHIHEYSVDTKLQGALEEWKIVASIDSLVRDTTPQIENDFIRGSDEAIQALAAPVGILKIHKSYYGKQSDGNFYISPYNNSQLQGIAVQITDGCLLTDNPCFNQNEYHYLAALALNPSCNPEDLKNVKVDLVKSVYDEALKANKKGIFVRATDEYSRSFYQELGFEEINDQFMKAVAPLLLIGQNNSSEDGSPKNRLLRLFVYNRNALKATRYTAK